MSVDFLAHSMKYGAQAFILDRICIECVEYNNTGKAILRADITGL